MRRTAGMTLICKIPNLYESTGEPIPDVDENIIRDSKATHRLFTRLFEEIRLSLRQSH